MREYTVIDRTPYIVCLKTATGVRWLTQAHWDRVYRRGHFHNTPVPGNYPVPAIPLLVDIDEEGVALFEARLIEETHVWTGKKRYSLWHICIRHWENPR